MKGRFENCIRDMDGFYHVTYKTKDSEAGTVFDEFHDKDAEITVKEPRKEKTTSANAYMWQLCTLIAEKLSSEGTPHTKEDIYRQTVRECGVYRDIPMLSEGVDTLRKAWEMHGIAWLTEIVDYLPDKSGYYVRCYYGSSKYSGKQLSRLIDSLVQDCDSLGIDHRTPEEINNMLSLWEQERKKNGRT